MPTADAVREKAISLAAGGTISHEAVQILLEYCRDRRVAVVLALRLQKAPATRR